MIIYLDITALKSVRIRSVSSPYFTCIFPHTPYLSVFSPNAGKCGKIRPRITPNTGTSYAVYYFFFISDDISTNITHLFKSLFEHWINHTRLKFLSKKNLCNYDKQSQCSWYSGLGYVYR